MPEITRPSFTIPDNLDPKDTPKILRAIVDFIAQQNIKVKNDILRDARLSDQRDAKGLRCMEGVVNLDKATQPEPNYILTAIDGKHATWAPIAGTGVTGGTPGGVAAHNILDGAVHLDSVAQGVTKGSLVVGNSTPKWDELVVGGTNGHVLTVDSAQTLGVKWAAGAAAEVELLVCYGDGVDGSPTMDGAAAVTGCSRSGSTYTATRDLFYATLTVNSGVILEMAGYRLYAKTSIANAGTIRRNGNAGGNGGAAAVLGGAAGTAGAALDSSGAVPLGGSTAGTAGRAGGTGVGATGTPPAQALGEGGNGGGGGRGEDGELGNAGGAATSGIAESVRRWRTLGVLLSYNWTNLIEGGTGGRGGSAGGGDGVSTGGGGGGGGSGGGIMLIWAKDITNTGTISCNGGAGGNGGASDAAGGAGGGGGGGGGGYVYVIYDTITVGTLTAAGGAAGLTGTNGTSGTDGTDGSAGSAGNVVRYCRLTGVFS